MPRPRIGSVFRHGDHWDIQVTLPNGGRSNPACQPATMSKRDAKAKALEWTQDAARPPGDPRRLVLAPKRRRAGASPALPGETADAWFARYFDSQLERGHTSVDDNRGRWRKWCSGRLGRIDMRDVTRDDIEGLVEDLDASVRLGALAWKTALNCWGLITKGFDEATNSKVRALRVLEANPCAGIRGPDRGTRKAKQFLYPSEHQALLACDRVPMRWRRLFAITTYLYLRAAEVRGLEWPDFDFDHAVLHLHRTVDDDGEVQTLKGEEARRVPIEPRLLPLLMAMHEAAGGVGRVIERMPREEGRQGLAAKLRHWLLRAGVDREDLHVTDRTRRSVRFHDLRSSGATWRAVRGDNPMAIMQACGHRDMQTTMAYVRTAEVVGASFGEPFPSLPPELYEGVGSSDSQDESQEPDPRSEKAPELPELAWRSQRELNPRRSGDRRREPSFSAGSEVPQATPGDRLGPFPTGPAIHPAIRRRLPTCIARLAEMMAQFPELPPGLLAVAARAA